MKAKLISYTIPTDNLYNDNGIKDGVDLIKFCALKMPVNRNVSNSIDRDQLVAELIRYRHWNPLELIAMTLEIETTVDLSKELFKHKSFTFQTIHHNLEFKIQEIAFGNNTSPNRFDTTILENENLTANYNDRWKKKQQEVIDLAQDAYKWAKSHGIHEQVAQCVLPVGNLVTRFYMHGNLRRWINFIETRGSEALYSTRNHEIALACAQVIATLFPKIDSYLTKTNL